MSRVKKTTFGLCCFAPFRQYLKGLSTIQGLICGSSGWQTAVVSQQTVIGIFFQAYKLTNQMKTCDFGCEGPLNEESITTLGWLTPSLWGCSPLRYPEGPVCSQISLSTDVFSTDVICNGWIVHAAGRQKDALALCGCTMDKCVARQPDHAPWESSCNNNSCSMRALKFHQCRKFR